jgi:membrane fusion protein, multidrug efflux system
VVLRGPAIKQFSRLLLFLCLCALCVGMVDDALSQGGGGGRGTGGGRGGGRGRSGDGPFRVVVAAAHLSDVPVYLETVGTTRGLNTAIIRSQVDGTLISVNFREGQDVKRGDLLAKVDPTTYQAVYNQALAKKAVDEAQLANAKRDLERYTALTKTNAVSRQQMDTQVALIAQLEAQVRLDQAQIDSAKTYLDYTTIVSPLDGRIGVRLVDQGNIVKASHRTGIAVVTQIRPITALFTVPQQRFEQISQAFEKGRLPVEAIDSENGTVLDRGVVQVINNQFDEATATVQLKAEFPNSNLQLWPGEFIFVRLLIETLRQALVIPSTAVRRGPNGTFVYFVQAGDRVAVRPVVVAHRDQTNAVIANGLQAGDRVVTLGFAQLLEGRRVIVSAEASPQAAGESGDVGGTDSELRTNAGRHGPGRPKSEGRSTP